MDVAGSEFGREATDHAEVAISASIFALVAVGHIARLVQRWDVPIGEMGIAMSVSWVTLVVSVILAVWVECCCAGEGGSGSRK
jgi:hypothetical protein